MYTMTFSRRVFIYWYTNPYTKRNIYILPHILIVIIVIVEEIKMAELNMEWYKKFSWNDVPFEDKVGEHVTDLIAGYEDHRTKITKWIITKKRLGIISGPFGVGKSTLREWTKEQLDNNKLIIVNSIYAKEKLDDEEFRQLLIRPVLTFFDKMVSHKKINEQALITLIKQRLGKRRMYVLLDEIQDIPQETFSTIRLLSSADVNLAFLLCLPNEILQSVLGSIEDRDKLSIQLERMKVEEAKEMLQKRIQNAGGKGIKPFDDKIIQRIVAEAGGRPRVILDLANNYALNYALEGKWGSVEVKNEAPVKKEKVPTATVLEPEPEEQARVMIKPDTKSADNFTARFAQLAAAEQNIAKTIAKLKEANKNQIINETNLKEITVKIGLRRLQGKDPSYSQKKANAPLPLIETKGSKQNMIYSIRAEYKAYLGQN
jgi:type II secretory pathway predicted ATPase ExeA